MCVCVWVGGGAKGQRERQRERNGRVKDERASERDVALAVVKSRVKRMGEMATLALLSLALFPFLRPHACPRGLSSEQNTLRTKESTQLNSRYGG